MKTRKKIESFTTEDGQVIRLSRTVRLLDANKLESEGIIYIQTGSRFQAFRNVIYWCGEVLEPEGNLEVEP